MATASLSAKKVSAGTRARKSTKPISKPISKPVKFSSPALEGCLSLSFVKRDRRQNSNWHLPPPPDNYVEARRVCADGSVMSRDVTLYGIGCDQGTAAAREYLSMLNHCGSLSGGFLQNIVLDMLKAESNDHLRGQVVGFFHTLESRLSA